MKKTRVLAIAILFSMFIMLAATGSAQENCSVQLDVDIETQVTDTTVTATCSANVDRTISFDYEFQGTAYLDVLSENMSHDFGSSGNYWVFCGGYDLTCDQWASDGERVTIPDSPDNESDGENETSEFLCNGFNECIQQEGDHQDFFTTGRQDNTNWDLQIKNPDTSDMNQSEFAWANNQGMNFEVSYDPATGVATYIVGATTNTLQYDPGKAYEFIVPFVKGNGNGNNAWLTNMVLNGDPIDDLHSDNDYWGLRIPLSDEDQENGFTLTGMATLMWNASGHPQEIPAFHVFAMNTHDLPEEEPEIPEICPECEENVTLTASKTYDPSAWNNAEYIICSETTFNVPESIPVTDGNAGNHWATLWFDNIGCLYQGGSSQAHPNSPEQLALGLEWNFVACYDAYNGVIPPNQVANGLQPGDDVNASSLLLEVNGDSESGMTEGQVTLQNQLQCEAPPELEKVSPILECVEEVNNETFTAHFGYLNPNDDNVSLPIGEQNKFTGGGLVGQDQGQPTLFEPGRTPFFPDAEFSVDFDGSNLVWTLNGKTSTASSSSQRCEQPEEPPVCFERVCDMPVSCNGQITYDDCRYTPEEVRNNCRNIVCESGNSSLQVKACDKPDTAEKEYFEMYRELWSGGGLEICIGDTCISDNGFARSGDFPICTEGELPEEPEQPEEPEEPEGNISVDLSIAPWFPQGPNYVFVCDSTGFTATSWDWQFGDGAKQLNSGNMNVWHTYDSSGNYTVSCTASDGAVSASDSLGVEVEALIE